ncbi:MAG: Nramp family divalent metal transporter [Bacteroidetes bacterium]|nr:Nramp family divalent metal transporter [Bacteroidota bacterium]
MNNQKHHHISLSEVHESVDMTSSTKKGWRKWLPYFGPAYLVSVGYMDPGNWATDLQGGARFGYSLIWVLIMSNLMALLLQSLSTRLGIVRRRDLAQANRDMYPRLVNFCLYILAELAIAACDLAEVLGMAIGIHLLTGLPILWGVCITVLDTFLLLWFQKLGMRRLEAFIIALILIIGGSFLVEIFLAKPSGHEILKGFIPTALSGDALYIAVGIIGATVMPHNLYLHSSLVQTRKIAHTESGIKKALRFNFFDSTIALNAAFLVNAAILILAASVFFKTGHTQVAKIEDAHTLLAPLLGSELAPILFAIALIAAGQSSTITGTLAGQIVMEGYLNLRINPWMRRLLTRLLAIIPSMIVILVYGDQELDSLLILSQVILSAQLGFAIIPLIFFVSDKSTMGKYAIALWVKILSWLVATVLIFLNIKMVAEACLPLFQERGHTGLKILLIGVAMLFAWLFIMMIIIPIMKKARIKSAMHGDVQPLVNLETPVLKNIAIALDFSNNDEKLIAFALSQGRKDAKYILLHIVETAAARFFGAQADDAETRTDLQRLEVYATRLKELGYDIKIQLGYKSRVKEIVRIVQEEHADMLVMGAHRHKGLKDFLYGETVNQVRHRISIPVLIVN